MKKITALLSIILCLLLFIPACSSSSGDPEKTLTEYLQAIKDGNYDLAYSYVSANSASKMTKENFTLFLDLKKESSQFKDFKLNKTSLKAGELNGVSYSNIATFDVTDTENDYFSDKDETTTYTKYVVDDNGTWKVDSNYSASDIAELYYHIAFMYTEGKGKDKNYIKAIENYKNALTYDSTHYYSHYGLARVYLLLNRYDESITEATIIL